MGKYISQVISYTSSVANITSELSSTLDDLKEVENLLSYYDANTTKDLLTYNVLVSNQDVYDEIDSLIHEMEQYIYPLKNKASELDAKLEEQARKKKVQEEGSDSQDETE